MNWAWWDGKMSFEHYREEHGLDSETLLKVARSEAGAEQKPAETRFASTAGSRAASETRESSERTRPSEIEEIASLRK
jgi:hypothetical protein